MMQARSTRLVAEPVALVSLRHAGLPFGLTARETVVLRHIADGACNREVAERLGVDRKSVV